MDATGRPNAGLLGYDDLAAWRPGMETPLTFDYAGLTVCKTQPWGQGPVFLQQLALLAGFDLAAMGPGSADFIHTVAECAKLAFADREAWYGDPGFTDVPIRELLSPGYADQRRRLVGRAASRGPHPRGARWTPATCFRRLPSARSAVPTAPVATVTRGSARAVTRALIPAWRRASIPARASRRCRPARTARGHLPRRRRRPVRQHRLGHAQRGLAAVVAGRPRARLLPGHPGADVHAGARAAGDAGARQAPPHHAVPEPRAARRRARTSRSAHPAGTSRTSGRWPSSSTTCTSA